jgi:hypothetical protein
MGSVQGLLITGGFLPDKWVIGLIKSGWGLALVIFLIILVIFNSFYPISASKDTDNQE